MENPPTSARATAGASPGYGGGTGGASHGGNPGNAAGGDEPAKSSEGQDNRDTSKESSGSSPGDGGGTGGASHGGKPGTQPLKTTRPRVQRGMRTETPARRAAKYTRRWRRQPKCS
ncbi:unnamed protein product [Ectocarpus fasciculatus]